MLRRLTATGRLLGVALLPLCAVVACLSPTLPLPPPAQPEVTRLDEDHVKLVGACGSVQDDADVQVIDTTTAPPDAGSEIGLVFAATDCGSWSGTIFAHVGDVLTVTQQFGGQSSPALTLQVN